MKFPKLWNGSSPIGEGLVRGLQRSGAPFLSAVTADGVTAGKMGRFSEVKQLSGDLYFVWSLRPYRGVYGGRNLFETGDDPGNRVHDGRRSVGSARRMAGRLTHTISTQFLAQIPFDASSVTGGGVAAFLKTSPGVVYPRLNAIFFTENYFPWSADVQIAEVPWGATVFASSLDRIPYSPVAGTFSAGNRWWGVSYGSDAPADPLPAKFARFAVRETPRGVPLDYTLEVFDIDAAHGPNYGGLCFRTGPAELTYLKVGFEDDGFRLFVFMSDDNGVSWQAVESAALYDLIVTPGSFDSAMFARVCGNFSVIVRRLHTGQYMLAIQAEGAYVRDGDPPAPFIKAGGIDPENVADPPPDSGAVPGWDAVAGVTVLMGDSMSELAVTHRFFHAGQKLQARSMEVSGAAVALLLTEAEYSAWRSLNATNRRRPQFSTGHCWLAMSQDSGQTWDEVELPRTAFQVGWLTVDADGRFLLPVLDDSGDEPRWTVFAFRSLETFGTWPVADWLDDGDLPGGLVCMRSNNLPTNPMPGTPWVCDDRITPPWETQ